MISKLPKIAFVHDWLTTLGGSEKILAALLEIWPDAPVHTLVHDPFGQCKWIFEGYEINTSFIQKLPFAKIRHRIYLPLMPLAVEQFDVRRNDIVISCSHAVAHGVITQADQLHINYICIPVRYAWHLYQDYLQEAGLKRGAKGLITRFVLHYLRLWDLASSKRVDYFVAISHWVARNVWKVYRRKCEVIYPPVDVDIFTPRKEKENFYLTACRMVPYKNMSLIVNAFSSMPSKKLIVIGDGPELDKLSASAGPNIQFLGYQPSGSLIEYMQRARAFVFSAVEDFGIVPIEAQACGTPVIAYGKGGVLETVVNGKTGLFFHERTADSLAKTVDRFEQEDIRFDVRELRKHAEKFSKARFQKEFRKFVDKKWGEFQEMGSFL